MKLRNVAAPACVALFSLVLAGTAGAEDAARIERGRYLATIMDCGGCHTPGALKGEPDMARALAGSDIGFEIPGLGIFYPPNLTADEATGLGSWSKEDIVAALREGVRPDGRELAPAMPWRAYGNASDDDLDALATYLRALQPVENRVPAPVGPSEKAIAPYLTVKFPG
ncbi:c-type cytochrome [Marinimicrococcus flavescens]|uniref:C-type cytochrome n=1 Tax=Marinimicrococcus flavescens TaxID=3031815 RepID=A0AAP3XSM4_9PROT|nr:c-type cytochrome [Marinimicrococcus flavescens]